MLRRLFGRRVDARACAQVYAAVYVAWVDKVGSASAQIWAEDAVHNFLGVIDDAEGGE